MRRQFFLVNIRNNNNKKKGYLFPDCAGIDCEACHKGKEKCGEKNRDAAGLNNLIIIIIFFLLK